MSAFMLQGRTESLQQRPYGLKSLNIYLLALYKKSANPCIWSNLLTSQLKYEDLVDVFPMLSFKLLRILNPTGLIQRTNKIPIHLPLDNTNLLITTRRMVIIVYYHPGSSCPFPQGVHSKHCPFSGWTPYILQLIPPHFLNLVNLLIVWWELSFLAQGHHF